MMAAKGVSEKLPCVVCQMLRSLLSYADGSGEGKRVCGVADNTFRRLSGAIE